MFSEYFSSNSINQFRLILLDHLIKNGQILIENSPILIEIIMILIEIVVLIKSNYNQNLIIIVLIVSLLNQI